MLWKRIVVGGQERVLVAKNGRFHAILTPGTYRIFTAPGVRLELEKFNVRDFAFRSTWTDYLIQERPEIAEHHFTLVETTDVQVAMVYADGNLIQVLPPAKRVLFWRGPVQVTAEIVDVVADTVTVELTLPAGVK